MADDNKENVKPRKSFLQRSKDLRFCRIRINEIQFN